MEKHGKALSFDDFRATYDHRSDSIILTSADADLAADGWRVILNSHTPGERILRSKLQQQGLIRVGETLPDYALYPNTNDHEWWQFPLGLTYGGEEVALDLLNNPHTLLVGKTGSGASVVQRSILHHVADHMGIWDVLGIDLKKLELQPYKSMPVFCESLTHVTNFNLSLEALRAKHEIMEQRLTLLSSQNRKNATDFVDHAQLRGQLIVIDEIAELLDERSWGLLRSERHSMLNEITSLLLDIARRGGAAHVHLLLRTQRLDFEAFMPRELLRQLTNRILVGSTKAEVSTALFGIRIEAVANNSAGRGLVHSRWASDGSAVDVQFYHSYPTDFYLE